MPLTSYESESPVRRMVTELRQRIRVPVILAFLVGIFYWPMLALGTRYQAYLGGDFVEAIFPNREMLGMVVRSGALPLWNPYVWSGHPMMADPGYELFYPPLIFTLWFEGKTLFVLLEMLGLVHLALGGALMYLLVRRLGLGRGGGLGAAICFMFNGFFQFHQRHTNLIQTAIWLPAIILLVLRAMSGRRLRDAVAAGICLGMAALTGFVDILIYMLAAMLFCCGWQAGQQIRSGEVTWRRGLSFALATVGITACLGLGIGAIQLLPLYELSRLSTHTGYTFEQATSVQLTPAGLLSFFIPGVLEGASSVYCGAFALFVAIVGLWMGPRRHVAMFGGLGLVSLALALGRYSPLFKVLYTVVPGFSNFRTPERWLVLYAFAVAALCGFGVDALIRAPTKQIARPLKGLLYALPVVAAVFVTVAVWQYPESGDRALLIGRGAAFVATIALAAGLFAIKARGRCGARVMAYLVLGLLFADAFVTVRAHRKHPTRDDPFQFFQERRARIASILAAPGTYRVYNRGVSVRGKEGRDSNWPGMLGLEHVRGYGPLPLRRYVEYVDATSRNKELWDALNVKYFLKDFVVRSVRSDFLPRAYLVNRYLVETDSKKLHSRLARPGWVNLRACVVLEELPKETGDTVRVPWREASQPTADATGTARLVTCRADSLAVSVDSDHDSFLVLSEVFYPGWQATLDGRPVEILRANWTLRAIFVPRGSHLISLRFRPRSVWYGAAISLMAAIGGVGTLIRMR